MKSKIKPIKDKKIKEIVSNGGIDEAKTLFKKLIKKAANVANTISQVTIFFYFSNFSVIHIFSLSNHSDIL